MADERNPSLLPTGDRTRSEEQFDPDETRTQESTVERTPTFVGDIGLTPSIAGYEITGELARGGMGVVYSAKDLKLKREVAIKTLLPGKDATRFVIESEIAARLPHPGIPPVYALGELDDGSPYLAMKLIRGRTLYELLKRRSSPADELSKFIAIFEQIAQAVGFAHEQGIIHRDLKPLNVMVGAFGEVQVMDWGLAKDLVSREIHPSAPGTADDLALTSAGAIMGTPGYMAPEQARGELVDARADVFSLGAVLAAILTGKPAFVGTTAKDTIEKSARGDLEETLERLATSGADVELQKLTRDCLAIDPANRPSNAKEVAERVADYRLGVEQRLKQAETAEAEALVREAEQKKRRRVIQRTASIGSLAAIVTVVIVAVSYIKVNNAETEQKYQKILTGRETWKSQFEAARREGQRGNWKKSLEILESMDDEFATDRVARKLEMVRAHDGLAQAERGIEILASIEDPGPYEADILLARAAYPTLDQKELAEFDAKLQQLLDMKTLSPANAAFVEGLLAESTTDAIAAFRRALAYDVAHRDARIFLACLLLAIAEHDEALRVAEAGRTLYPLDPRFGLNICIVAALSGDRAKAQRELEVVKKQFDEETAQTTAMLVEHLSRYNELATSLFEKNKIDYRHMVNEITVWRTLLTRSQKFLAFRLYPFRSARKIGEAIAITMSRQMSIFPIGKQQKEKNEAFMKAFREGHPEGALSFFSALTEVKEDDVRAGDAGFRRHDALARQIEETLHMNWFVPRGVIAAKGVVLMMLSEMALVVRRGKAPKDFDVEELKRRLKAAIEIADQPPRLVGFAFSSVAFAAELSGDPILHRRHAERWVEMEPKKMDAQFSLVRAEARLGNSIRVLELLDTLQPTLTQGTDHYKLAEALRKNAAEKLRAAVAKLK